MSEERRIRHRRVYRFRSKEWPAKTEWQVSELGTRSMAEVELGMSDRLATLLTNYTSVREIIDGNHRILLVADISSVEIEVER